MAAMGAESTPIVAARATIRNMDRIAWMKRVASRFARATVRDLAPGPYSDCARFSIHSPVQLALVPPREPAMHRIGRGSSRKPSELVPAEVLKWYRRKILRKISAFFRNSDRHRQFILARHVDPL
jgi:hypothetical protein